MDKFNAAYERSGEQIKSFLLGYRNAEQGHIMRELTHAEIATRWPYAIPAAFANGMIDGLSGDNYRYEMIMST